VVEWKEIAQIIANLSHAQARIALLSILKDLVAEQEIDMESFERIVEVAQTWPKEGA